MSDNFNSVEEVLRKERENEQKEAEKEAEAMEALRYLFNKAWRSRHWREVVPLKNSFAFETKEEYRDLFGFAERLEFYPNKVIIKICLDWVVCSSEHGLCFNTITLVEGEEANDCFQEMARMFLRKSWLHPMAKAERLVMRPATLLFQEPGMPSLGRTKEEMRKSEMRKSEKLKGVTDDDVPF